MVIRVVVDGLIGSGKSTTLDTFARRGYDVVYQALNEWTLFSKFYDDIPKYALPLQIQILRTYLKQWRKDKNDRSRRIVIYESFALASLETFARMFRDDKLISEDEYTELQEFLGFGGGEGQYPSLYIYLDVDVNKSYERVLIRNRTGEKVTKEYLHELDPYYEEFLRRNKGKFPILRIKNEDNNQEGLVDFIITKYFNRPFSFTIEGCVGTGKSYSLEAMNSSFNCLVQRVPNDLIEKRYTVDKANVAAIVVLTQKWFIDMYAEQLSHHKDGFFNGFEAILSVPLFTKYSYDSGEISLDQYNEIMDYYKQSGLPDWKDFKVIVWARPMRDVDGKKIPDIDLLLSRIKKRKRDGEDRITKEFLVKLDQLHEDFFKDKNVLHIDNSNLNDDQIEALIYKRIQKCYFE